MPTQPANPRKRLRIPSPPPSKRSRAKVPLSGAPSSHGSYLNYYHRRHAGHSPTSDDRLSVITPLLGRYKSPVLLDIGCNDGAVTASLAPSVASAVGVDIDAGLVAKARKRVRATVALLRTTGGKNESDEDFIPISCHVVQGPPVELVQAPPEPEQVHEGKEFPFNLCFRCENFAAEKPGTTAMEHHAYDVVLCLSVTKWVHLHGGDAALKRLFRRMSDCLRPGGVLILEPQPKKSYKRARQKKIRGANRKFGQDLKIKPEQFKEILLKEGGFERFELLRDVAQEKGKMFNRPIMAFFKRGSDEGGAGTGEAGLGTRLDGDTGGASTEEGVIREPSGANKAPANGSTR